MMRHPPAREWSTVAQVVELVRGLGPRAIPLLCLMVAAGFAQGVGLMLLIPLLQIVGLGDSQAGSSGVGGTIRDGLSAIGLPVTLPVVLVAVVVLVMVQALLLHWQALVGVRLVQASVRRRQNELFRNVSFAPWIRMQGRRTSELTLLLTHDHRRIDLATQHAIRLLGDAVLAGAYLVASFLISVPLAALTLTSGLMLLLVIRPLHTRARRSGERLREAMRSLQTTVSEQLAGMKLSKAFGREAVAVDGFEGATAATADEAIYFARAQSFVQVWHQVGGACLLAVFVFAAAQWLRMPASDYLVMIVIFARLVPRLSLLHQTWQHIEHCLPSFEAARIAQRIFGQVQEVSTASTVTPMALRHGVELRHVDFRYAPDFDRVLRGVDLTVPARRLTAILGPSGSGKSTLVDILIGLMPPERGDILVDGQPLIGELVHRWRRSVGYVPQDSFLFHDTLRANLLWAHPGATEEDMWRALRLGSADAFVSSLADGLDTVVGDRGERLSGGERQRIALARALLIRPALLVLDEATSQVDPASQDRILEAVAALRGEMTVVVIAHHAPVEAIADRVVVLEDGVIRPDHQPV